MTDIDITQTLFNNAELAIQEFLLLKDLKLEVKKGSVINLLLIRPYAYVYAKINKIISLWIAKTSIAYLLTTQDTSDSIADNLASNYFIYRKLGIKASGTVILTLSANNTRIAKNTAFTIDGNPFLIYKNIIITDNIQELTETTQYIQARRYGNEYKAIIPVYSAVTGALEIPAGVSVLISNYIACLVSALVYSPITGGSSTLTNQLMFLRCKNKCCSSVGSLRAIYTRLNDTIYNVLGVSCVGTNLVGCKRSFLNNLLIPAVPAVDTYIKTQNQPAKVLLLCTVLQLSESSTGIFIDYTKYPQIAGAVTISSIQCSDSSYPQYSILFGSSIAKLTADSARLSTYQTATVKMNKPVGTACNIEFITMPNVYLLQKYIDAIDTGFIGEDILIKSGIPVKLNIHAGIYSLDDITELLLLLYKTKIVLLINNTLIGAIKLNMDDISKRFSQAYPSVSIKLPYTISCDIPTTNGGFYTFNSLTGVVDLSYRKGLYLWLPKGYFIYTDINSISLDIL